MSITIKLHVDGKAYTVLQYGIDFHQQKDSSRQPTGRIAGGLVHLTIEAMRDTVFHHWALAPTMMKDVEIVFSPVTRVSNSRIIKLYDVYLARIKSNFSNQTSEPMKFSMVLSPGIFVDGDVVHKKPWHVTDLEIINSDPTPDPATEIESEITAFYITDQSGNKKPKYNVGDVIYVTIESKNKVGTLIDVCIPIKSRDFKYNGRTLPDDTLSGYKISRNKDVIQFEVVRK